MSGGSQDHFIHFALIPHGHCYLWDPGLVGLHVASDALISIAYFSIPLALIHFVRQRKDLPYSWLFQLFGAFIVTCGLTHIMEIWTLWHPIYWVSGVLKASTAIISLATAGALIPVIPQALLLPSREELEHAKVQLEERVKERTQALQVSEERLQMALSGSGDGLWDWNIETGEVFYSSRWEEMLGYEAGELPGHVSTWENLIHPEDKPGVTKVLDRHLQNGEPYTYDYRFLTKSGEWQWMATYGQVVKRNPDGTPERMSGTHKDISARKYAEQQLADSLAEKSVMLQEIHHRVKNNLQVICSLLNLQTQGSPDPKITEIMKESQNRVKSMALVHENLYQSQNLSKISLETYVRELTNNLLRSYRSKMSQIKIHVAIASIYLDIDTAVPCGLIINELVSNALKYAFPDQESGEIKVKVTQNTEKSITLTITDNGMGLPHEINVEQTQTLGLRMVKTLTRQISGTLTVSRETGTSFNIHFPQPSY